MGVGLHIFGRNHLVLGPTLRANFLAQTFCGN